MPHCDRRRFLQGLYAAGALEFTRLSPVAKALAGQAPPTGGYTPRHIQNEYTLFLPGEREALEAPPLAARIEGGEVLIVGNASRSSLQPGSVAEGWRFLAVSDFNGAATAVFEMHVTHRGAIAMVTPERGVIALIPKSVGNLSAIRPRQIDTAGGVRLERVARYIPGPNLAGNYILRSQ